MTKERIIFGEPFTMQSRKGSTTLTHAEWSLSANGRGIEAAEHEIMLDAAVFADALDDYGPGELTAEALRMRAFGRICRRHLDAMNLHA